MNNKFNMDVVWQDYHNDPILQNGYTGCNLTITINGNVLTANEDHIDGMPRDYLITSTYPLALWFAGNYYRLLWEDEGHSLDYAMSHNLCAADHGFLWPNLVFQVDNNDMIVYAKKSESVFIYEYPKAMVIPKSDFVETIENFIDKTVAKLAEFDDNRDDDLTGMWEQIKSDQLDPDQVLYNIMEAKLNYDYAAGSEGKIMNHAWYRQVKALMTTKGEINVH